MSRFTATRPQSPRLRKPRNPFVAPALMRQAGRHASQGQRQAGRRELSKQILQLIAPDRSP